MRSVANPLESRHLTSGQTFCCSGIAVCIRSCSTAKVYPLCNYKRLSTNAILRSHVQTQMNADEGTVGMCRCPA